MLRHQNKYAEQDAAKQREISRAECGTLSGGPVSSQDCTRPPDPLLSQVEVALGQLEAGAHEFVHRLRTVNDRVLGLVPYGKTNNESDVPESSFDRINNRIGNLSSLYSDLANEISRIERL